MDDDISNIHATGESSRFVEKGASVAVPIGRPRGKFRFDSRKLNIDFLAVSASGSSRFVGTADSVMAPVEVGRYITAILKHNGMHEETDDVQVSFINGMLYCSAVNGTSGQAPARAEFKVIKGGSVTSFNYNRDVCTVLANDQRRFFRGLADETRNVLRVMKMEFETREGDDERSGETRDVEDMWQHVLRVAAARGISRIPDLIHDTADFCTGLTILEKELLASSKKVVLATSGSNALDNPAVLKAPVRAPATAGYASDLDY